MPDSSSPPVPALVNGDRLTRREFERRYAAMPDVKKAELIEGTVYYALARPRDRTRRTTRPYHDMAGRLRGRHARHLRR